MNFVTHRLKNPISMTHPQVFEVWQIANKTVAFIAGGAVRSIVLGEEVADIDVFQTFGSKFDEFVVNMKAAGYAVLFQNSMLTRLVKDGYPTVDAVRPREAEHLKTFGSQAEVIANFDFTVCRGALTHDDIALIDPEMVKHAKEKRLVVRHIVCPLSSVKRIAKYAMKGYTVATSEVYKLFSAWTERTAHARAVSELLDLVATGTELTPEQQAQLGTLMYVD